MTRNPKRATRNEFFMYRVGIDIGGTFTDMLLVGEDGIAVIGKTLTTPGDPSSGLFSLMCVAGALLLVRRRSA